MKFQETAVKAIVTTAANAPLRLFTLAKTCAMHAKRATVKLCDIELASELGSL